MALVTCKDCKKQVSTNAKHCPHCGAKPPARTNIVGAVIIVSLGMLFFGGIISTGAKTATVDRPSETATVASPAQAAPEHAKPDPGVSRAAGGAMTLKQQMRNPDSFKLVSAEVMSNGAVCYAYRAQNGFGGVNVSHAVVSRDMSVFINSDQRGFVKAWNGLCAGRSGVDVTSQIRHAV